MNKERIYNYGITIALAFALLIVMYALAANMGVSYAASTSNAIVNANVNVGNVIYIAVAPTTNSIGDVYPTVSYPANTLFTDTDTGGNLAANVFVSGAAWAYSTYSFGVSNTTWSATLNGANTPLSNTLANTDITILQPNTIAPSQSNSIYFGVSIPASAPAGVWSENLIFENENLSAPTNSVTENVILTANVQSVCYISLSPNAIGFGSILPTANVPTSNVITDTDSGGNVAANVLVSGTTWTGTTPFGVGNTLWSATSENSYTGTALSSSLALTPTVVFAPAYPASTASNSIYFGLGIPGGTAAGVYTQTITIENSC